MSAQAEDQGGYHGASRVEERVMYRAGCYRHRWTGNWRPTRWKADEDQRKHDVMCIPDFEGWSQEVTERWRAVVHGLPGVPGIHLRPSSLRTWTEGQRVAVLDGLLAVINGAAGRG